MKLMLLAFAACSVLAGCATDLPEYVAVTSEARTPKPASYDYDAMIFGGKAPNRPYAVIGYTTFATDRPVSTINTALKTLARRHGADAIVIEGPGDIRQIPFTIPDTVRYRPVTTYQTGTATVTGPYGQTAYGNYSGTQTSYVPQVNPGYSGVRNVAQFAASFIVFVPRPPSAALLSKPRSVTLVDARTGTTCHGEFNLANKLGWVVLPDGTRLSGNLSGRSDATESSEGTRAEGSALLASADSTQRMTIHVVSDGLGRHGVGTGVMNDGREFKISW